MNLKKASPFACSLLLPLLVGAAGACGGAPPPTTTTVAPCAPAVTTPPVAVTTPSVESDPTLEDAQKFMARVDADLRRLWTARDRAAWISANFITDDSEFLSAQGEEVTAEYMSRTILEARKFEKVKNMPPDLARQFALLKLAQGVPAPNNAKERSELASIESSLQADYGKGKYCPPGKPGNCKTLDDLSRTLRTSRKYDELLEAWKGWHSISAPMKDRYARYVELGNKGAKEIGFDDLGALWRAGYDMPPADFEADIERLWQETKPLYDELHCYVRARLRQTYGKDKVPEHAPIPAHLLGNMWAQEWNNVYDLAEPYKGQPSLDVSKKLKAQKGDERTKAVSMVKLGERFFTSLGMDPLPQSFWERSLFVRPKDRDVVCHASAWDPQYNGDLRVKMCIEPTEEDLITIHHELGHDFYYQQYFKLPILFQQGANDGFHEGIGDTLALSVTPKYLKDLGLVDAVPNNPKAVINQQMKMAMEKISFLPFGLLIDKWRWDVFSGKTPKDKYNEAWWKLREKYQGVAAPVARSEADFDPGAKYHIPASTPYIRYFLARIYQFQFHRALCKVAQPGAPLDQCSIYGNKEAGAKLKAMLAMGASKPWPDAMEAISGERKGDPSAMLEYFAPLRTWLKEQTKNEKCGW